MATAEGSAFEQLWARGGESLPEATWEGPGDLGRKSIEVLVARTAEARDAASHGVVRLHGAGVAGHSASLDSIGSVATKWQACVTAVGAAIEGSKSRFGPLARSVIARTQLTLNAAPSAGSIVLDVSPTADPAIEAYPNNQRSLIETPRPLADQATERLIELLGQAVVSGPDLDALGEEFLQLGPRVASHVQALADVLDAAHFDVDLAWMEPGRPTVRASVSAGTAAWLSDFVNGRNLAGTEEEMIGTTHTISDVTKWLIETAEGMRSVDASSLEREVVEAVTLGQVIRLVVAVSVTERPDGTTTAAYEALEILGAKSGD